MPDPSTRSTGTLLGARPSTATNEASLRARWAREVRSRLSSLQLSPTRESEIVEELSQHLDDRWRELVAGGVLPEEAERLALAEFSGGDVLQQGHPSYGFPKIWRANIGKSHRRRSANAWGRPDSGPTLWACTEMFVRRD